MKFEFSRPPDQYPTPPATIHSRTAWPEPENPLRHQKLPKQQNPQRRSRSRLLLLPHIYPNDPVKTVAVSSDVDKVGEMWGEGQILWIITWIQISSRRFGKGRRGNEEIRFKDTKCHWSGSHVFHSKLLHRIRYVNRH